MDSSAGSLTGILNSLFVFPGDYEQCLAIRAINSKDELPRFKGKHFLLRAAPSAEAADNRICQNGIDVEKLDQSHWQTVQSRTAFLFCFPKYYLLRLGMCLPSTCTAQDARNLLNQSKVHFRFTWKQNHFQSWLFLTNTNEQLWKWTIGTWQALPKVM